ncbi:hypothetical protein [Streptomyces tendae]|uniref:hypothetical protein n=1 Tax=Streptomyces tendae TaxID=1932 RepID=UPI0036F63E9B
MCLRAIATFDVSTGGGVGHGLATWFGAALAGPLRDRLEQEQQGTAFFSASTRATERSPRQEYQPLATGWEAMRQELLHEPETAHVLYMREQLGTPLVHVRSATIRVRRPNAEAQLLFGADCGRLDDAGFCAGAVEFLVAALDAVNPAFAWLGADALASEETNLDWVLHRRVRDSVRQARTFLRGYSWTTVCPEELSVRLGGPEALAATGAFHRSCRSRRAVWSSRRTRPRRRTPTRPCAVSSRPCTPSCRPVSRSSTRPTRSCATSQRTRPASAGDGPVRSRRVMPFSRQMRWNSTSIGWVRVGRPVKIAQEPTSHRCTFPGCRSAHRRGCR